MAATLGAPLMSPQDAALATEVSSPQPWKPASNAPPAESGTPPRLMNPRGAANPTSKTARSVASLTCSALSTTMRCRNSLLPPNWSEPRRHAATLKTLVLLPRPRYSLLFGARRSQLRPLERTLPYAYRLHCW
jgi:hypothetical protein